MNNADDSFQQQQQQQQQQHMPTPLPGSLAGDAAATVGRSPGEQPPRCPKRLGKEIEYYEDRIIGQGVFGVVYYGKTRREGRPLAVKLFLELPSSASRASMANIVGASGGDEDLRTPRAPNGGKSGSTTHHQAGENAPNHDHRGAEADQGTSYPEEIKVLMKLKGIGCPNILELHSSWNRRKKRGGTSYGSSTSNASGTTAGGGGQQQRQATGSLYRRGDREFLLVTEYCAGGDLQSLQRRTRARFSESTARSLIYQLCNALWVLYLNRVIHRDVKPANLLLTSMDPASAVLKLADWGMAKAAPENHSQQLRDSDFNDDPLQGIDSGMFYSYVGTPMYRSPERIRQEPYSYKADVYSAGMVLYELMTGHFVRVRTQEDLLVAVPRAIRHLYRKYEGETTATVPLWLDLVKGMTEAEPNRRLSIEEVLRHPWFHSEAGPPLPPLTLPLSPLLPPTTASQEGGGGGGGGTVPRPPCHRPRIAPTAPPDDPSSGDGEDGAIRRQRRPATLSSPPSAGAAAAPSPAPSFSPRQSPFTPFYNLNLWTVLAAFPSPAAIIAQDYIATRPHDSTPPQHQRHSLSFACEAKGRPAQLPGECGPHIITHAVKHYVRIILNAALTRASQRRPMENCGAVSGPSDEHGRLTEALTLVAFSKVLLTVGYAAFTREVELHGCLIPPPAVAAAPSAPPPEEDRESRMVSREYSELHPLWESARDNLEASVRQVMTEGCTDAQRRRIRDLILAPAAVGSEQPPGEKPLTGPCAEALLFSSALKLAMSAALEDHIMDEAAADTNNNDNSINSSSSDRSDRVENARSIGGCDHAEKPRGQTGREGCAEDAAVEPVAYAKARALLRVLLQQAVLTEEEVGLHITADRGADGGNGNIKGNEHQLYLVHVPLLPTLQDRAHPWGGQAVDHLMEALVSYARSKRNRHPWSA